MVDLNNFAIIVKNSNALKIINYLNQFMVTNHLIGNAEDNSYYYVNINSCRIGCTSSYRTISNIPIYALSEFIDLVENSNITHELW